jgi:hypothetical protein
VEFGEYVELQGFLVSPSERTYRFEVHREFLLDRIARTVAEVTEWIFKIDENVDSRDYRGFRCGGYRASAHNGSFALSLRGGLSDA